jgi:hypothetical protein
MQRGPAQATTKNATRRGCFSELPGLHLAGSRQVKLRINNNAFSLFKEQQNSQKQDFFVVMVDSSDKL